MFCSEECLLWLSSPRFSSRSRFFWPSWSTSLFISFHRFRYCSGFSNCWMCWTVFWQVSVILYSHLTAWELNHSLFNGVQPRVLLLKPHCISLIDAFVLRVCSFDECGCPASCVRCTRPSVQMQIKWIHETLFLFSHEWVLSVLIDCIEVKVPWLWWLFDKGIEFNVSGLEISGGYRQFPTVSLKTISASKTRIFSSLNVQKRTMLLLCLPDRKRVV